MEQRLAARADEDGMIDPRFQTLSPLNMGYRVTDFDLGIISADTTRNKLALLGGGAHTRQFAPLDDPEWEVWSLNNLWPLDSQRRMRADRWFELHPMDVQSVDDMRIINSCPVPLYVLDRYPEVTNPNAVRFPREQVLALGVDFFPCTFCYQLALALLERKFTTIGLYGVDLWDGSGREMALERAGVAFWLGLALGTGIHLELPGQDGHGLVRLPYLYGYDYHKEKAWVDLWVRTIGMHSEGPVYRLGDPLRV